MNYEILELAKQVRAIYDKSRREKFPLFIGSLQFPRNSCERASRVFGHLVKNIHPNADVKIVAGYCYSKNEYHYWALVNELVYDLTCDQFNGFSSIILGEERTLLSEEFNSIEIFTGENVFDNWYLGGDYDKIKTIEYVEKYLKCM